MNDIHPYWEIHNSKGPYLLLIHGFLSSRNQWLPNLDALSAVTTPVLVELYGHGRSPAPEDIKAYHPDAYVDAFENIRRQLGVSNWYVCGQSLGASLSLRYALRHPSAVKAQVFTNTVAALAEKKDLSGNLLKTFADELEKGDIHILEKLPMHPLQARFLREDVKTALIKDCSEASPLGVANTMRYTMPEVSVREEIHQNKVPSLLACGKWEKRFEVFRTFARDHMPHLDIVDLDAGHAVNVGAFEAFNEAVVSFIQRQEHPHT